MLKRIQKAEAKAKAKAKEKQKILAALQAQKRETIASKESDVSSSSSHEQHVALNDDFEAIVGHSTSSQNVPTDQNAQISVHEEADIDPIEDVQQDLDDEANIQPRKKRGPTTLPDIWNLRPGEELPECFNKYNQCVDDGQLAKFCGTIARNPKFTPLEYDDWRMVDSSIKEQIWEIVKSKFKLGPSRRSWVLREVGNCLRQFKHTLYADNFHKYKSLAELKANPDPRTQRDQWEKLVTKWYSQKWQTKSEKGQKSREEMKMPQTSGTISFARRVEMEYKETGQYPSRTKIFIDFHKHKNGTPVSPEAVAILERLERFQSDMQVNGENSQVSEDFVNLEDDPLFKEFGPERDGRVRGMGFGVTPKTFQKTNSGLMEENKQLKECYKVVEEDNKVLHEKIDKLTELVASKFS